MHKPGVCEAKYAKHKLLTTKACNKLLEPKGKHQNFTGGRGKNTAQTADSEAKYG